MPIVIREALSQKDVDTCVEIYAGLSKGHFIPFSVDKSKKALREAVFRKKFLRILEIDDKVRGWILADKISYLHVEEPIMQQLYYASDLSGILAVKSVKLLHEAMYEYALETSVRICMSQGSCFDEENVMARILEKYGWQRAGHTAVKFAEAAGGN